MVQFLARCKCGGVRQGNQAFVARLGSGWSGVVSGKVGAIQICRLFWAVHDVERFLASGHMDLDRDSKLWGDKIATLLYSRYPSTMNRLRLAAASKGAVLGFRACVDSEKKSTVISLQSYTRAESSSAAFGGPAAERAKHKAPLSQDCVAMFAHH